jgi:hypothetical protein
MTGCATVFSVHGAATKRSRASISAAEANQS